MPGAFTLTRRTLPQTQQPSRSAVGELRLVWLLVGVKLPCLLVLKVAAQLWHWTTGDYSDLPEALKKMRSQHPQSREELLTGMSRGPVPERVELLLEREELPYCRKLELKEEEERTARRVAEFDFLVHEQFTHLPQGREGSLRIHAVGATFALG